MGAINILTQVNANGAGASSGGCWYAWGRRLIGGNSYQLPMDLEVNGVVTTFHLLDKLTGGDNPSVDFLECGYDYALVYRCDEANQFYELCAGCGGGCGGQAFYIFQADDDCCCGTCVSASVIDRGTLSGASSCGGIFQEKEFYVDLGIGIDQNDLDDLEITSFKINNSQQLFVPESFGIKDVQCIIASTLYPPCLSSLMNTHETFNNIFNGTEFEARLPTSIETQCSGRIKSVVIKYPICYTFEIIITNISQNRLMWKIDNNNSYINTGADQNPTWVDWTTYNNSINGDWFIYGTMCLP